jgi:hypothetical protein
VFVIYNAIYSVCPRIDKRVVKGRIFFLVEDYTVLMLYQELGENPFQTSNNASDNQIEPTADSIVYDMVETARTLLRYAQTEFRAESTEQETTLVRFNQTDEVAQALWQKESEPSHHAYVHIYDRLGINMIKGSLIIALDSRRQDLPAGMTLSIDSHNLTAEQALKAHPSSLRPRVSNVSLDGQDKFARKRQRGPVDLGETFGPDVVLGNEDITLFMTRFYDITAIHGLSGLRDLAETEELRLAS